MLGSDCVFAKSVDRFVGEELLSTVCPFLAAKPLWCAKCIAVRHILGTFFYMRDRDSHRLETDAHQFATPAFGIGPDPYQATASASASNLTSRYCVPHIFRKFLTGSDMLILQCMCKGTHSPRATWRWACSPTWTMTTRARAPTLLSNSDRDGERRQGGATAHYRAPDHRLDPGQGRLLVGEARAGHQDGQDRGAQVL